MLQRQSVNDRGAFHIWQTCILTKQIKLHIWRNTFYHTIRTLHHSENAHMHINCKTTLEFSNSPSPSLYLHFLRMKSPRCVIMQNTKAFAWRFKFHRHFERTMQYSILHSCILEKYNANTDQLSLCKPPELGVRRLTI